MSLHLAQAESKRTDSRTVVLSSSSQNITVKKAVGNVLNCSLLLIFLNKKHRKEVPTETGLHY